MVFRLLHTLMNETMTWTLSGHTFLSERYASDANRKNSMHIGIAERYDLVVPQAGGPRLQASIASRYQQSPLYTIFPSTMGLHTQAVAPMVLPVTQLSLF